MATRTTETAINVPEIKTRTIRVNIIGKSPLICHRMSQKAMGELLSPQGKKNAAEKQASIKHNPIEEFQASTYVTKGPETLIAVMASAFKGAMSTAALDLPGTKKAQIGRLVYVEGDLTPVYGTPELFMSVVRSADMNKTPDIRTRAILPEWGCRLDITFVEPLLSDAAIVTLLTAAGITVGIGDWRPEKGKGNYGQFQLTNENSPEFQRLLTMNRAAQIEAMENPKPYDEESETLLAWWKGDIERRGLKARLSA